MEVIHMMFYIEVYTYPTRKTFAMWKIAIGLARETSKKRGNKKWDESITPIRYNVNHGHTHIPSKQN